MKHKQPRIANSISYDHNYYTNHFSSTRYTRDSKYIREFSNIIFAKQIKPHSVVL